MKKIHVFLLSLLFALTFPAFGQIIGGEKNGQSSPTEVGPSEITNGGLSGDVNLFSGTYNSSFPLGTVSTLTGLSFTATLSYSSTFTSGDNMPHTSGIPYGEGWGVDIPSISVSMEDYNKYTLGQSYAIHNRTFDADLEPGEPHYYTPLYNQLEAELEGSLHWFSPTLNIPGIASGRLVYKYKKGNHHHFVLHAFERYIEALFDGGSWEVILDDGTRYELIPAVVNYRNASNQRVQEDAFSGYGGGALASLVMPKQEILTWYCSRIVNRNMVGSIHFKYETFGGFNYYKSVTDQSRVWAQISESWLNPQITEILVAAKPEKVYTDIFLKEIDSGYERLVFNYGSISAAGADNLLELGASGVNRKDSLFSYKVVYKATKADGFDTWHRYKHHWHDDNINNIFTGPMGTTNPYRTGDIIGSYRRVDAQAQPNEDVAFDHGYLESERIDGGDIDLVPGDIYEVIADINSCAGGGLERGCFFDVNIATGYGNAIGSGEETVDAQNYENGTGQSVFSTFNQAIKWFTHGNSVSGDRLHTSNYFAMPDLPNGFGGFHIQVGPANSDHIFSKTPSDMVLGGESLPTTCLAYQKEYFDNTTYNSMLSGDNIPHNFGIGLPWWMLSKFYSSWESFVYCPEYNTSQPGYLSMRRWWNDDPEHGFPYPNAPTMAGDDIFLDTVKLVRYSKNPYMLKEVKKQIFNGGTSIPQDPEEFLHTTAHFTFEYDVQVLDRYRSVLDGNFNITYEASSPRNVFLLKRITQLPYQDGPGNNIPLVTSFGYDAMEAGQGVWMNGLSSAVVPVYGDNSLDPVNPNLNSHYPVLDSIVDPLGKVTNIEYAELGLGGSYAFPKFQYVRRPSETNGLSQSVNQAPSYVYQVNMRVNTVRVNEANGEKCWNYEFPFVPFFFNDRPSFDSHFTHDKQFNYKTGYHYAIVHGPSEGCGGGPETTYRHHTSELLWGKLYDVVARDAEGAILSTNSVVYDTVVAFETPRHRNGFYLQDFDYKEYIFDVLAEDRPLLGSDFEEYHDAIHDFVDGHVTTTADGNPVLGYNGGADPPIPPTLSCSSCDCFYDYADLGHSDQGACDSYLSLYYTWLFNRPQGWHTPYNFPWAKTSFYESPYERLIEHGTGGDTYLYSFFLRKKSETQTTYDQGCVEGIGYMSTSTAYEYFDADYTGKSNSSGYAAMGIDGSQLFWEPSWQLYKKSTTSQDYQATEEYFYLYDLVNNSDYQISSSQGSPYYGIVDENGYPMLSILWYSKKKRDMVFEKRVTNVSPGGENKRSTYYTYSMGWDAVNGVDTVINLVNPYEGDPCDTAGVTGNNGGGGGNGGPPLPPCFTHKSMTELSPVPQGYCEFLHDPPYHTYCTPCGFNPNDPTESENGYYNNYLPNVDTVVEMVNNTLQGKIMLKSVVEQVRPPGSGQSSDLILDHSGGMESPAFPYDTLAVQTILERNPNGFVLRELDEKSLATDYTYEIGYLVDYVDCSYSPPRMRSMYLANHIGLPITVKVGSNTEQALSTKYEYFVEDNNIKQILDPNEMKLSYEYDGFGRMAEAWRNDALIQGVKYSNANGGSSFKGSAALNYVDALNYVEEGSGWGTKGFVDPLGRKTATVNYSGGSKVNVEDNIFDIYDRPVMKRKRHGSGVPTVYQDYNVNELNFEYDTAPRSRAVKSAKYGLGLEVPPHVEYGYCMVSRDLAVEEISSTGQAHAGEYLTGSFYQRAETTDEDGKEAVTFTDAGGNVAATVTNNGGVGTVFLYGPFGSAIKVSNGENQEMLYEYNFLGQLKKKDTPDEGAHLYAYNQSGQMIGHKDANNEIRVYGYDRFGRMAIQAESKIGQTHMFDTEKDGMPWREDRDYGFLASALGNSEHEKEWFYEKPEESFDIHPDILQYFLNDINGEKGRLVHSISYDNDGQEVEMKFFSYNKDGFREWEVSQFNSGGIGANDDDLVVSIRYPEYNLQGSYKAQNVDILGRGNAVDFQHFFVYDSWNRISKAYIAFADKKLEGYQFVDYTYDDILGVVTKKRLYNNDLVDGYECRKMLVDSVEFFFDQRERLTNITSVLYGHELLYDDNVLNDSHKNHNGNINATAASYDLDRPWVLNTPENFYVPTTYGYKYDNLNRLTEALAALSVFSPNYQPYYTGDPEVLGDVSYTYDKVGNFKTVSRGNLYNSGTMIFGVTDYAYTYGSGNNQLSTIDISGQKPPGCETVNSYSYSYDGNGNLTSDSKKGLAGVAYGRANLPFGVTVNPTCENSSASGGAYLYDGSDARVFKDTPEGKEFYLRDAAGHELYVHNITNDAFTWYLYGNERVAKIGSTPPYTNNSPCRPRPACDGDMLANQQAFLQGLAYITSPSAIAYPSTLIRIRLCDGSEPHLLPGELAGLAGNYTILQQIDLYGEDQQFSVWQANGLKVMGLADVLVLRTATDQFLLNGYDPCGGFACPRQQVACPDGDAGQQAASIAALQGFYSNLQPGDVDLPTRLVRIRLCGGAEMYVLLEMLQGIAGHYTILQQVEVTSADQSFTVSLDGGAAGTATFGEALQYLLNSNKDIAIDGYTSCINGAPCDPALPVCSNEMQSEQLEALEDLQQLLSQATPSNLVFPTRLYRIRLCSGDELYVFKDELPFVPGNFTYLQDILVASPSHVFQITVTSPNTVPYPVVSGHVGHLLGYRANGKLFSVGGYVPCGELSPCHPNGPGCSPKEQADQAESIADLIEAMENLDPLSLVLPTRLFLVRFCEGSTLYVLEHELSLISGSYAILQAIDIGVQLNQTFNVIDESGASMTVGLTDLLKMRAQQPGMVVEGYGCVASTTETTRECTYSIDQQNWRGEFVPNSCDYRIYYDKVVWKDCGEEKEEILRQREDVLFPSNSWTTFRTTVNMEDNISFINSITLNTLNPVGSFNVTLNPGEVFNAYPGLTGILSPNADELRFDYGDDPDFAVIEGAIELVIEHAIQEEVGSAFYVLEVKADIGLLGAYVEIRFKNCFEMEGPYVYAADGAPFTYYPGGEGLRTGYADGVWVASFRDFINSEYEAPCGTIESSYFICLGNPDQDFPRPRKFVCKDLEYSTTVTCEERFIEVALDCGPPIIVWDDSTFIACDDNVPLPDPDGDGCPDATTTTTDLSEIAASAATTTAGNIPIPNAFHQVRFSNGERRLVLQSELGLIDDCAEEGEPQPIDSSDQVFYANLPMGGGNVTLDNVLGLRAAGLDLEVGSFDQHLLQPGNPALAPYSGGPPTLTFFIYDHLGNSRVLYTNELRHCDPDSTKYLLEHVIDYYPFGKTLREYVFERERFQTTYHERDEETGLDYRGARFYDGDVGRFLSVDPKALDFAAWSTYSYTFDNPVRFIDPDGRSADDHIYLNMQGEEIARVKEEGPDRYFVASESCDASGNSCSDYIEVNSPETVKGDLKEKNPWNGSIVNLDEDDLRSLVSGRTGAMATEVAESAGPLGSMNPSYSVGRTLSKIKEESQEGGAIDFVDEFKNGTIYEINGVHYNSHEGLNYLWGASLDNLGVPQKVAVSAAKIYHKSAYERDVKAGEQNKYVRVGPNNEPNHNKAIMAGYGLFK